MENKKEEKQPEERLISLKYTESEVAAKVRDLQVDEDINLFIKVENGKRKYEELIALSKALEPEEEKK